MDLGSSNQAGEDVVADRGGRMKMLPIHRELKRYRDDLPLFAARCLKIKPKKPGPLIALRFNRVQLYLHDRIEEQLARRGFVRIIILKGRQTTISTYVGARYYHKTSLREGFNTYILSYAQDSTDILFEIVNRFWENSPFRPQTDTSNAKELRFDLLHGGYAVGTAGSTATGRSGSIQLLQGDECAYWKNAPLHFAGVVQAVPLLPGTEVILLSTANGMGNEFHGRWQQAEAGIGDYEAIFLPWYWAEDYWLPVPDGFVPTEEEQQFLADNARSRWPPTMETVVWRRAKIAELKDPNLFKQEYPACVAAGERVGTARGLLPIEALREGDLTSTGLVAAWQDSGERETITVRTSMGYEVTCTKDHRIALGSGEWCPAEALIGRTIRLQPPMFADSEATTCWRPFPCVTSTIDVTPRFARFLGYFMGDGSWYDGTLSIVCTGVDDDVVDDVATLMKEFVGDPSYRPVGKQGGGTEVRIGRKDFHEALDALGIIRATAPHRIVCVPEAIFCSPKHVIREFLGALFEADGFCSREGARVVLFSKHERFLRDIQLLLLGFGITGIRRSAKKTAGDGHEYMGNELVLRATETRAFLEQIGFLSLRKQGRLMAYGNSGLGRPPQPIVLEDRVVSITDGGIRRTYDPSIPTAECFDAGGILVHNSPMEAFMYSGTAAFIAPADVAAARMAKLEPYGPLIVGVDPARVGRFSCAWRRGRVVTKVESRTGLDTLQGAAWLKEIIDKDKPVRVFVDLGDIGKGIYDILMSWGAPYDQIVVGVNFGDPPLIPQRILDDGTVVPGAKNRRAEMWSDSRDWLNQPGGAAIPDQDSLQADACGPTATTDLGQRLVLESKEHMASRGIRSPDEWDAVALTFAEPVKAPPPQAAVPKRMPPSVGRLAWLGS